MLQALLVKRLAAAGLSFAISVGVPYVLKDKPVLKFIAGQALPAIVSGR